MGRRVAQALVARGEDVRGFDVHPSDISAAGYTDHIGSLDDPAAVSAATAGVEAVLHLGAFMSWSAGDRPRMFRSNVEGTRVLLDACVNAGVRRFIFASSGEVYPENAPIRQPITEDHPLRPNSPYGLTKRLGEELVMFQQRAGTMETVILRFSHTQDAEELLDEDSFFSGPRFFLRPRIRQQEALGNSEVAAILRAHDPGRPAHMLARNEAGRPYRMHITDTRDMVDGVILAMDHAQAADGIFNLGATEPVDFAQILPRMSEITGYSIATVDLPGPGVSYHTSNDKIRRTLGFEPQWTIERMLDRAAEAREERTGR